MVDRVQDRINCKIQVYQKAILSNRQVLKINTNFKEVGQENIIRIFIFVLKFQTLVACQKGQDNQSRPRSDFTQQYSVIDRSLNFKEVSGEKILFDFSYL